MRVATPLGTVKSEGWNLNQKSQHDNPGGDNLAGSIFHVHPGKLTWTAENRLEPERKLPTTIFKRLYLV